MQAEFDVCQPALLGGVDKRMRVPEPPADAVGPDVVPQPKPGDAPSEQDESERQGQSPFSAVLPIAGPNYELFEKISIVQHSVSVNERSRRGYRRLLRQ